MSVIATLAVIARLKLFLLIIKSSDKFDCWRIQEICFEILLGQVRVEWSIIFFFYTGAKSARGKKRSSREVVLKLCDNILIGCNYKLFYDNWFSTLNLGLDLKEKSILTTATIRSNRLAGCSLKCKAEGAGNFKQIKTLEQLSCVGMTTSMLP